MDKMRLILSGQQSAAMNMAIDEAVLRHREEVGMPTLRFYTWKPSAVTLGYFQSMDREVDAEFANSIGVDIVRRITGGGAVYHDKAGEVTYSIIVGQDDPRVEGKVVDSYPKLCGGIVTALKDIGLDARFKPINDIIVGDKKISGNAQSRKLGGVLQHGTIIYDVDPDTMFRLLRVSDEKMRHKMCTSVFSLVTSIKREGVDLDQDQVIEKLVEGFRTSLEVELVPGELTESEKKMADDLAVSKYSTDEWNRQR